MFSPFKSSDGDLFMILTDPDNIFSISDESGYFPE
jgi:hypothetical protein